jgi:hypothetical protein
MEIPCEIVSLSEDELKKLSQKLLAYSRAWFKAEEVTSSINKISCAMLL